MIDMKNYYEEKVSAIRPLEGRRVHMVFSDGFEGEVDLSPLIGKGPLYEPLRADVFIRRQWRPGKPPCACRAPGMARWLILKNAQL